MHLQSMLEDTLRTLDEVFQHDGRVLPTAADDREWVRRQLAGSRYSRAQTAQAPGTAAG